MSRPVLHKHKHKNKTPTSSSPRPSSSQSCTAVSLFGPQLAGSHPFPIPLDTDAAPHVTVCKRRGYYHDWAAAQPQGEAEEEKWKPDMVVAFNSGAHTLDTHYEVDGSQWTPTLALLAEKV